MNSRALTDADLDVCRVAYALRRFNPKARFKMSGFADPLRFIGTVTAVPMEDQGQFAT